MRVYVPAVVCVLSYAAGCLWSSCFVLLKGCQYIPVPKLAGNPTKPPLQGQLSVVFVRSFLGVAELVRGLRLDCRVEHVSTDIFIFICMVRFV